jgi:hypothetical protein
MFTYNVGNVLARSIQDYMGRQDSLSNSLIQSSVYFYTGAVPDTFDDVPFDLNPNDISRNAIAMSSMNLTHVAAQDVNLRSVIEGNHRACFMPVKHSVWDTRRQKYRVAPRYAMREDLSDVYRDTVSSSTYESRITSTLDRTLGDQFYFGDLTWHNERRENNSIGFYALNYAGRYPLSERRGLYFEYEQDVTIDAVDFWQFADSRYTGAQITIEYWDPTLLEGAGDWVATTSDAIYDADKEFVWDLPVPITSSRFKVSTPNTGSSAWHIREISLLSSTEPFNVVTADITWALVVPGWVNARANGFSKAITDSYSQEGTFPYLICDVGQPGDDTLITLNQARNLPGFFNPKILNFSLEFEDPQL